MKSRTRLWTVVAVVAATAGLLAVGSWRWTSVPPEFAEGDLIFQTSRSQQSRAILLASRSLYTHMGILKRSGGEWVVVEAVGPVKETPLNSWVERGKFARYAVYRPKALTVEQVHTVFSAAAQLYGRPYDLHFSFNNQAIYCSELIYLAYRDAGVHLGRRQRIADLSVSSGIVKALMAKRAKSDEECGELDLTGEACVDHIVERELITPVSIARDSDLLEVFSNYPL